MNFPKNFIFILSVLIILYSSDVRSQSEWIIKSTGCNLNSVFFYDEMAGWVVGDSGTIFATIDAGANWQCVTSGTSQSLKSVYFINALTK